MLLLQTLCLYRSLLHTWQLKRNSLDELLGEVVDDQARARVPSPLQETDPWSPGRSTRNTRDNHSAHSAQSGHSTELDLFNCVGSTETLHRAQLGWQQSCGDIGGHISSEDRDDFALGLGDREGWDGTDDTFSVFGETPRYRGADEGDDVFWGSEWQLRPVGFIGETELQKTGGRPPMLPTAAEDARDSCRTEGQASHQAAKAAQRLIAEHPLLAEEICQILSKCVLEDKYMAALAWCDETGQFLIHCVLKHIDSL